MFSRHLPGEERRRQTVEAVVALAAERDPAEITTTIIAHRLGLTQGALFRHFPNKEAMLEAVMGWVADRLLGRVEEAIAGAGSPLAALEAVFLAHCDFLARHPGVLRLVLGELQRSGDTSAKRLARRIMAAYVERVRRLMEEGRCRGELAPDLDVETAAPMFLGALQSLAAQALVAGDPERIRTRGPRTFAVLCRALVGRAT